MVCRPQLISDADRDETAEAYAQQRLQQNERAIAEARATELRREQSARCRVQSVHLRPSWSRHLASLTHASRRFVRDAYSASLDVPRGPGVPAEVTRTAREVQGQRVSAMALHMFPGLVREPPEPLLLDPFDDWPLYVAA